VDNTGAAKNFGTATGINFTAGVATVAGGNNGVLKLYNAQTANITVTDGTISQASALSITVVNAALNAFTFAAATPQTNAVAFTGTNTLTAIDVYGNPVVGFNASTTNVTITTTLPGSISGLSGGNVLNAAGDFSNGVADLTSLGIKYTGAVGT